MAGFLACYFKFFLTTTTVFVGVFVLLCFFLVIYYLLGACKGLRRGYTNDISTIKISFAYNKNSL